MFLTANLSENLAVMRVDFQVAKIFRLNPVEDTQKLQTCRQNIVGTVRLR